MNATAHYFLLAVWGVSVSTATVKGEEAPSGGCPGTVTLFNSAASAVTNGLTLSRVPAGTNFLAALYYLPDRPVAPTDADFDVGTALEPNVGFLVPGIFNGGTRSTPLTTPGGGFAWFQVRVWESVFGPHRFTSYETARNHQMPVKGRLPLLGRSNIVRVQTGNPCGIPPTVPGNLAAALRGWMVTTDAIFDHAPPTLSGCPMRLEVIIPPNQSAGVAQFEVTATDEVDPTPTVACVPPSGNAFALGDTVVTCTARDFCGNQAQCSFTVSVGVLQDATPPTIVCPADLTVLLDHGQVSRVVSFVATAQDDADPAPSVTCVPPSGTAFTQGTTLVRCVARDWASNTAECTFGVTVQATPDTNAPMIICPSNVTTGEYAGRLPKRVMFNVGTTDDLDPQPVVSCQPASGSSFPLGETPVTCTAQDASGNTSTCSFSVRVELLEDLQPPVVQCSSNRWVPVYAWEASRPVPFVVTATDDVDEAPEVICVPPSGASFALGETTVVCVAQDFSSNITACSFTVTLAVVEDVLPPVLDCSDRQVYINDPSQAVEFSPVVHDDVDPAPQVWCEPPSGTVLALGINPVFCMARDLGSNTSACAFTVSVALGGAFPCGGTVLFANNAQSIITNVLTGLPVPAGSNFLVALYALPDQVATPTTAEFDYGAVLLPAVGFVAPGRFFGGTRTASCWVPPGGRGWFQVRVWESAFGPEVFLSFDEASDYRTPLEGRLPLAVALPPVQITTGNPFGLPPSTPGSLSLSDSLLQTGSTCLRPPAGLVAWWTGDGDSVDLAGGEAGLLRGATYGTGKVGGAFRLGTPRTGVLLPDSGKLRLESFTLEAWVQRASPTRVTLDGDHAALLAFGSGGYGLGITNDGRLFLAKVGQGAVFSQGVVADTGFHHVAVTKEGSNVVIYLDGIAESVGPFDPHFVFDGPAAIGAQGGELRHTFWGSIDEVSIYNRALSAAEIQSVAAATAGKCLQPLPPVVAVPPQSLTTCLGASAAMSVAAAGSPPLSYQWFLNDEAVADANGPTLHLPSITAEMLGHYSVVVSNAVGVVTSAVAVVALDARPPIVTLNGNAVMVVECPAEFSDPGARAEDACGQGLPLVVHGTVPPHSAGTYTLTYTATDRAGQQSIATRTVQVVDTTPPRLSCPANVETLFTEPAGTPVVFPSPVAADLCDGPVPVRCVPVSGSLFPLGTTWVTCMAEDASGNAASCSFTVTVLGSRGAVLRAKTELEQLINAPLSRKNAERARKALEELVEVLRPGHWVDETHVVAKGGHKVFEGLKSAAKVLAQVQSDKQLPIPTAEMRALRAGLVQAARLLAVTALEEATTAGADPRKLARQWDEVGEGDALASREKFDEAIEHYRKAWQHATQLVIKLVVRVSPGKVRVEFEAVAGATYVIESSTNLSDWEPVAVRTAGPDGTITMEEATTSPLGSRFYRARLLP